MPELIRLNIPFIVILLMAGLAFGLSYLFYRKTNPPLLHYGRWILLILRALTLWLLFLIFLTPTAKLIFLQEKPESISVFVDNSGSMGAQEDGGSRWEKTKEVVRSLQRVLPQEQVQWFAFNTRITKVTHLDSLQPTEGATNFQQVLDYLRKHKFDKSIIVSDGVVTDGGLLSINQRAGGAIFTVPVGKILSPVDVFISEVQTPATAYQNDTIQAAVIVGARNLKKNITLNLRIKERKTPIVQRTIQLMPGSGQFRFVFNYSLQKTGLHHLTCELEALKGESNTQNNRFHFVQEILKSRKRVGLFASYPNYDLKFLKLAIETLPRFRAETFVEDNRGRFLLKSSLSHLDSMDIWIFVDFPGPGTSEVFLQQLSASWQNTRQNLLLMVGPHFSEDKFQQISGRFSGLRFSSKTGIKELTPLALNTPEAAAFVNLFNDPSSYQQFWSLAPPLQSVHLNLKVNTSSTVLVQSSFKGRLIPLIFLNDGPPKSAVINGLALWRWHFLLQPNDKINKGYTIFVEKLLGWLGQRTPFKPVSLSIDRKSGHIGQPFRVEVRVVDSRQQPVPNSSVVLTVHNGSQSFSLPVQKDEQGRFKTQFTPVRSGDYKLVARAFENNQEWGADSSRVIIIPLNREMIRLSPDTLFLKKLATFNRGQLIPADSLTARLRPLLAAKKQVLRREKEIELWYKLGLLMLILFLISTEWALRKRWNLI